ncbi:GntR family transcriptional regulator [Metabacillus sp. GX 13764]|uniref:GntR family transcriptional regulator n=1 Tax=Metabacillus kandeliae TaxID=2900151 RepID=UPI001E467D2E|nr:GntR family transcriptional regulator [Metabacillus kandeliae]MCD7036370.1 GntR family transcriptional regulator [Metabacillus kandeliae]
MINKESPLPIYYQLEEGIKKQIEDGVLHPGDTLPSEREYSEIYSISRMTVRQAISNLVTEGFLERKRGKGTFIAQKKFKQNLKGLTSFTEEMKKRGLEPETIMIHFNKIPASITLAGKLEIEAGTQVFEIKRIRLADGTPMAYESLYVPAHLLPELTIELAKSSIYDYAESMAGLEIGQAVQELEAVTAKKREAAMLEVKEGSPILCIMRKTRLKDGTVFEVVDSYYRADRYKFAVEMER